MKMTPEKLEEIKNYIRSKKEEAREIEKELSEARKQIDELKYQGIEGKSLDELSAVYQLMKRRIGGYGLFPLATTMLQIGENHGLGTDEVWEMKNRALEDLIHYLPENYPKEEVSQLADKIEAFKTKQELLETNMWQTCFNEYIDEENKAELQDAYLLIGEGYPQLRYTVGMIVHSMYEKYEDELEMYIRLAKRNFSKERKIAR